MKSSGNKMFMAKGIVRVMEVGCMNSKKTTILHSIIFLLPIFLLDMPQLGAQGVDVSTAADTKKERRMKAISDVKIPIEGLFSDYENAAIAYGKDGFEARVARKDAKEKSVYSHKGELLRKEAKPLENILRISTETTAMPDTGMAVRGQVIEFRDGKKMRVPGSHNVLVSPNGKYVFMFPGYEVGEKDWYIRLYDGNGMVLWEHYDVFCPDSDAEPSHISDFPVLWSPDGEFLAFLIEKSPEKICLFSAKGFEWSHKSTEGHPAGITIAKGGAKVIFGIRKRRTLQERMLAQEMREKGFLSWNPIIPVTGYCLGGKGEFLWKKDFLPADLHFSEDGKYFFTIRTQNGGEMRVVNADSGELVHEQMLENWYKSGAEGRVRDIAIDAENKKLSLLVEERLDEGMEWLEYMGGKYAKKTGPDRRKDLGYRLIVYDMAEILGRK